MTTKPKTLAACTVMLAGALAGCGAPREALKMHVSYHRANTAGSVVLGSPGSGDFGFSLASSGNTMLVGDDLGGADQAGVVYVYSKHRDGWVHTGSLLPPGQGIAAAGDRFGYSVAVSGNTAVVGAQSSGGGGDGQGQAFVFQ
ncbi:MAG TPA: hypothetical protein VFN61_01295, partial [Acidimicrobiales bacterium]|nr:hypothetical protein [Acidimicrobiales bacterium]